MPGLVELQVLVVGMFGCLDTHLGDVDARDLEFRRGPRTMICGSRIGCGEVIGQDFGLLPQGCDQSVHLAAVLRAFTDHVDVVVVDRAHVVVDDDGAFDGQSGTAGKPHVGADTCRQHQQIAIHLLAIGESDSGDGILIIGEGFDGALTGDHGDAGRLDRAAQHRATGFVELSVHQDRTGMHHRRRHTTAVKTVRRFESEQSAADDHRVFGVVGVGDDRRGVVKAAKAEYAAQLRGVVDPQPLDGREEGTAAGGDDQLVVGHPRTVIGENDFGVRVDPDHPHPGAQVDSVVAVPIDGVEVDVVGGIRAGEHVG
ncbi:Uncharacterised protein [Mycobacteroides abscessus subsp. abscessus]|nr:Uncharacterised protein [Mycobacteroides abscessus subsp. abscessus]